MSLSEPYFIEPPMDPSQPWLFPPSLDEMVPQGARVRVLAEVFDLLDTRALRSSYRGMGRPSYDPVLMTKLLAHAYSRGVTSSRRIAELCVTDVSVMWLVKGYRPDFRTISTFRKEKGRYFRGLFASSVRVCQEAGLVMMELVAVDGTKLVANASNRSVRGKEKVAEQLALLDEYLERSEAEDAREDALYGEGTGAELPSGYEDAKARRAKLAELARRLAEEDRKKGTPVDVDARVMKTGRGKRPGYNAEAAVDAESQVIVGAGLTTNEADFGELLPVLEDAESNTGASPNLVVADAGFSDVGTLEGLRERGQEALIPPLESTYKDPRNEWFGKRCFVYDAERDVYVCPTGRELTYRWTERRESGAWHVYDAWGCPECEFHSECVRGKKSRRLRRSVAESERERMRARLGTAEGQAMYRHRSGTVEPVFGQMKHNMGFDCVRVRGLVGAEGEFLLMCTVLNLLRRAAAAGRQLWGGSAERIAMTLQTPVATLGRTMTTSRRTTSQTMPVASLA